MLVLLTVGKY